MCKNSQYIWPIIITIIVVVFHEIFAPVPFSIFHFRSSNKESFKYFSNFLTDF